MCCSTQTCSNGSPSWWQCRGGGGKESCAKVTLLPPSLSAWRFPSSLSPSFYSPFPLYLPTLLPSVLFTLPPSLPPPQCHYLLPTRMAWELLLWLLLSPLPPDPRSTWVLVLSAHYRQWLWAPCDGEDRQERVWEEKSVQWPHSQQLMWAEKLCHCSFSWFLLM